MEFLMASIACCAGSTPEMAKKQVCITVLMRPPIPASRATLLPSMTKNFARCSISLRCTFSGSRPHTRSGPNGEFSKNVPPGARSRRTSHVSRRNA